MKNKDIIRLAYRNLKAGKSNVNKIVFSIGIGILLVLCYFIIFNYHSEYKDGFEKDYSKFTYVYKRIDWHCALPEAKARIQYELENKEYPNASEVVVLPCVEPLDDRANITPENLLMELDGNNYKGESYFSYESPLYATFDNSDWGIDLGYYLPEYNIFPDCLYEDGLKLVGELPNNHGEILVSEYFLDVYGFEGVKEDAIGKKVNLTTFINDEAYPICKDYIISGVFDPEELYKREATLDDADIWSIYWESYIHIYINFKPEDDAGLSLCMSEIRYYFDDYDSLVESYDYAQVLTSLGNDDNNVYRITDKGMELCVFSWIIDNLGKLLGVMGAAIILVVFFSLFYIIRFYFSRNSKYIDMLECIGMDRNDRIRLRATEMVMMLLGAIFVALYLTLIFLILFQYITNKFLSYGFTFF